MESSKDRSLFYTIARIDKWSFQEFAFVSKARTARLHASTISRYALLFQSNRRTSARFSLAHLSSIKRTTGVESSYLRTLALRIQLFTSQNYLTCYNKSRYTKILYRFCTSQARRGVVPWTLDTAKNSSYLDACLPIIAGLLNACI